ncbi:MAG: geranylgeranylglyceryl/heptaprenylglyceryl phosphate synthase [Candidatus Lokiarchaeota archaeon]|nr:geranylgeranylglyceryl/heptaprenylglyceryl phosphate synthase [Candidatus Lokiarchaeota archaeon]
MKDKIWKFIKEKMRKEGVLHSTLIDPDLTFQTVNQIKKMTRYSLEAGTNIIMVGGSTIADQMSVDKTVKHIKSIIKENGYQVPVIIFPGNVNAFSKHADAVYFMSLLNSNNLYWVIRSHVIGAPMLKMWDMETISLGYVIVEPGATAGFIGEAQLIPRNSKGNKIAASYALVAQYFGFKMFYLEGGSGVEKSVPLDIVRYTSGFVDIPVCVGGGINTPKGAVDYVKAGAKNIVQGTFIEENVIKNKGEKLKEIISSMKSAI